MSIIRCRFFRFVFILSAVFGAVELCRATAIETLTQLRALPREKAALGRPVSVEGQVLWVHPLSAGLFLHDGKKGAYVQNPKGKLPFSDYRAGHWIRVSGITAKGGFSPSILAEEITFLEEKPLMEAHHFFPHQVYSTDIDCDWVILRGRFISSKTIPEYSIIMLELDMNGVRLLVQLVDSPENRKRLPEVMYRQVRFNAVAGTLYNDEGQFTGRLFFVSSLEGVTIDREPEGDGEQKLVPIHELLRNGANYKDTVSTYGTVTHATGSEIFLRGERTSLKASILEPADVEEGDRIRLSGLVAPEPLGPAFLAREVQLIERRHEPVATLPVVLGREIEAKLNYELITLDVQLVDIGKSFNAKGDRSSERVTLLCRAGKYLVEARLPEGEDVRREWSIGSTLRLSGICHLVIAPAERWRMRGNINTLWLQLRDGSDVTVLNPPPWWTTTRVLWIAGTATGLSLLFLVWVVVLRNTVARQTRIIRDQVERETILNERQRIARELHDNLEQGLAGMVLQLKGLMKLVENSLKQRLESMKRDGADPDRMAEEAKEEANKYKRSIEVILKMITHCSSEVRSSILDLRGGLLERMDFISAAEETLMPLVEECGASLDIAVRGESRRLKQSVERSLLQLLKEAVSNAARHASPGVIEVVLDYQSMEKLQIFIRDDGCGFDVNTPPKPGHFGLLGMQERIGKLNGRLEIRSQVGEGTLICLELPADGLNGDG
ncbi:sensor histidine kinase [Verrucomicrobia bacterium S94]|nr:sensor histidine kinase [Verrucomicrobia bacterium S94]